MCTFGVRDHAASIICQLFHSPPWAAGSSTSQHGRQNTGCLFMLTTSHIIKLQKYYNQQKWLGPWQQQKMYYHISSGTVGHHPQWCLQPLQKVCNSWLIQRTTHWKEELLKTQTWNPWKLPRFHLEKPFVGPCQKPNALAWEITSHEVPKSAGLRSMPGQANYKTSKTSLERIQHQVQHGACPSLNKTMPNIFNKKHFPVGLLVHTRWSRWTCKRTSGWSRRWWSWARAIISVTTSIGGIGGARRFKRHPVQPPLGWPRPAWHYEPKFLPTGRHDFLSTLDSELCESLKCWQVAW